MTNTPASSAVRRPPRTSPPLRTGRGRDRRSSLSPLARATLWTLIFAACGGSIYFVSPGIGGVPLRLVFVSLLLAGFVSLAGRRLAEAVVRSRPLLLLIGYLAIVAFCLGLFQGELPATLTSLVADHVQSIIILLVAATATLMIGRRAVTNAFVLAVALSATVSVLQWLGVGWAIAIRDYLGSYQFDKQTDVDVMADRFAGLSYSAIILGNQVCLAFGLVVFGAFKAPSRQLAFIPALSPIWRRWLAIGLAAVALAGVSFIQGNRSPILGLLLFVGLLPAAHNPRRLLILLPVFLGMYLLLEPLRELASQTDYRIAATGDKSSAARAPLVLYGWRLFVANPFGYGITFDSRTLSSTVPLGDLAPLLSADHLEGIFEDRNLHNYWLIMLDMYGVFLIPILFMVVKYFRSHWDVVICFVPYMVHVTFHNAAPLAGDYMFWVPAGVVIGTKLLALPAPIVPGDRPAARRAAGLAPWRLAPGLGASR